MSDNPYESPDTVGEPSPNPTNARGFRLAELLVIIAVIGVLVALLLPARRSAGEAARRAACNSNLKNIALALQNYHEAYGAFPPAYTVDAKGKPLHSWRTLILPFVEEQPLYEKIDLSKPWDDPANIEAFEATVEMYNCPSTNGPPNHTTYLAIVTANSCLQPRQPRKLSEITDDHLSTLMVIDAAAEHHVHWMSPSDATEQTLLKFGANDQLQHRDGIQAAFVAGNVMFIASETSAETLRAMVSIRGGDDAVVQAAE